MGRSDGGTDIAYFIRIMKILYITYPDYIYTSGLIWNQVFTFLNRLCERDPNKKITLLSFVPVMQYLKKGKRAETIRKYLHPNIRLITLPAFLKRSWILPLFPIFFLLTLLPAKGVFWAFKPDLIHTRGMLPGWIASWIHGCKPWLLDMRGLFPEEGVELGFWPRDSLHFRIWKKIEKRLFKSCSAVNFVSEKMESHFASLGFQEKGALIPSGVDTRLFSPARDGEEKENCYRLVYSGSLSWENLEDLKQIYQLVSKIKTKSRLLVLSPKTSERKGEIIRREFLRHFSPEEFQIRFCWPEEVPGQLNKGGLGVLTRRPSTVTEVMWPIKCLEYWACGLPVLTTSQVASVADSIRKEGIGLVLGLKKPQKDQEVLVEFTSKEESIRRHCREVAESKYSLEKMTAAYEALYAKVLK